MVIILSFLPADKIGMKKLILYFSCGVLVTACSPQSKEAIDQLASETIQDIACKDNEFETKLWDGLKTYLLKQKSILDAETMQQALHENVEKLTTGQPNLNQEHVAILKRDLDSLIQSLLDEAPQGERVQSPEQLLILLSAIDVGDRSTVFRSYMQDKVRNQFTQLRKSIHAMNLDCPKDDKNGDENNEVDNDVPNDDPKNQPEEDKNADPVNPPVDTPPQIAPDFDYHKQQALENGVALSTFGGRWAFATAYQSCQSLQIPSLTAQSPEVKGISIVGKHSDGVGNKRVIASLGEVQSSHYYIKDVNHYSSSCFNVRQNPLIYDYGGKPYATTAASSPIDMFKNNGDGTSVLGIDCSGYVFTSLATAGLRLKEGRALKASDSWAWGSSSYVEPQKNGLTCLDKISVTPEASLKVGDIVAVYGHVLLIDKSGSDPFGINSLRTEGDCSKISSSNFDFTVAQSAPSKGGIGINYYEARYYLPTSSKMKTGLEKYAYYACLAKFKNKTYTPNIGTLSVVRHKGTAACMAPRVKMAKESCIQSCPSLIR